MYQIVNKYLLAGDKFMPEMHLRQPGFTYSACGPFTKNKQRIQKFMETGDTNYIYKNKLDKVCFEHDMAYGKYKDLEKRTQSDKVLNTKLLKLQTIQNMMDIKEDQLQLSISFLIRNKKEVVLTLCQINS